MGQYFVIANLDKREYIHPHEMDSGAKIWEVAQNPIAGVFAFLLRQSSEVGSRDIQPRSKHAGRWAGDRIVVVGGYDVSMLFDYVQKSPSWTEISSEIREEYDRFTNQRVINWELPSD